MSPLRANLEDLAVIAGFHRNPQLAAAIEPGHDRHYGHDRLAACISKRRADPALLAELDEVARGRERQLEATGLSAFQRLARRDPDRVRRLPAIMRAELVGRCRRKEEPGVEA